MKRQKSLLLLLLVILMGLAACDSQQAMPAPETTDQVFGIDSNINMETIDDYLYRDDVAYRDVRMLFDPADYEAIGGEADLTATIEGFKVVPFPYVASLGDLPVDGAYQGDTLFEVTWNADGSVKEATPKYRESMMIVEELFPKDQAIFIMCGGGGYSGMMKQLLIHWGWDPDLLYNVGGNWTYQGDHGLELIVYPEDANEPNIYATWRADYAYIDFTKLQELE